MRKKFLVTAATLTAVAMLTACGGNKDNSTPTPTPVVTDTPDATPTETPAPEVDHAQMIQNIYQAVQEKYGANYRPEMQVQGEEYFMKDMFKLDESWYDAAIVETPMMSMNVDMFAIIHPTEGNLENVANALKGYQDYLINDSFQYPMNMPKVQSSLTGVAGDYVYFVVLTTLADEEVAEIEGNTEIEVGSEEYLAAIVEAYKKSNQQAVDVINGVVSGEIEVDAWTETERLHNAVKRAYRDTYLPNMQMQNDEIYMSEVLKLDASWIEEAIAEVSMISTNVDTFVLVKATEGNLENVANALNAYKDYLVNDTLQYPMNEARVKSAVVATVGDYVCFSILGGVLEDNSWLETPEAEVEYYAAVNTRAVDVIRKGLGITESIE